MQERKERSVRNVLLPCWQNADDKNGKKTLSKYPFGIFYFLLSIQFFSSNVKQGVCSNFFKIANALKTHRAKRKINLNNCDKREKRRRLVVVCRSANCNNARVISKKG